MLRTARRSSRVPVLALLLAGLHRGVALQPGGAASAAARTGGTATGAVRTAAEPQHKTRSRRDLLLAASLGGAVGPRAARAAMAAQGAAARRPLRVCVVGAGSISREFALFHFGEATGTVVSSVVDVDKARAELLAADVGSVQAGAQVQTRGGSQYRCQFTTRTHTNI